MPPSREKRWENRSGGRLGGGGELDGRPGARFIGNLGNLGKLGERCGASGGDVDELEDLADGLLGSSFRCLPGAGGTDGATVTTGSDEATRSQSASTKAMVARP